MTSNHRRALTGCFVFHSLSVALIDGSINSVKTLLFCFGIYRGILRAVRHACLLPFTRHVHAAGMCVVGYQMKEEGEAHAFRHEQQVAACPTNYLLFEGQGSSFSRPPFVLEVR